MREPETLQEEVVGLRLPDGTEIFPPDKWHNRSLETPEDRRVIYESLQLSARNLGIPEDQFLAQYSWVTATRVTAIVWTDSEQAVPLSEVGYVEDADADGDLYVVDSGND